MGKDAFDNSYKNEMTSFMKDIIELNMSTSFLWQFNNFSIFVNSDDVDILLSPKEIAKMTETKEISEHWIDKGNLRDSRDFKMTGYNFANKKLLSRAVDCETLFKIIDKYSTLKINKNTLKSNPQIILMGSRHMNDVKNFLKVLLDSKFEQANKACSENKISKNQLSKFIDQYSTAKSKLNQIEENWKSQQEIAHQLREYAEKKQEKYNEKNPYNKIISLEGFLNEKNVFGNIFKVMEFNTSQKIKSIGQKISGEDKNAEYIKK